MELHDTKVTSRTQIARLLTHLQDLQCPLTVRVRNQRAQRTSILAVNAASDYLLLSASEISPGRPLPTAGQPVSVAAAFHGERARFESRVVEAADLAGKALVRVQLPALIDYRQRRAYFRVALAPEIHMTVSLVHRHEGSLLGTLEDLSLGGMGAFVESQPDGVMIAAELCSLELPDGDYFHSPLQITNTRTLADDARVRVGARFVDPSPAQSRKLERLIRYLEREQLKQQAL